MSNNVQSNMQRLNGSVQDLLSELRELGVRLWVEDDRLCYQAPKDALTPENFAQLRDRKAEILAFLQQAQIAENSNLPTIVKTPREDVLPLSFAQQRLWFLDQLEPNSPFYNISVAFRLKGNLNIQVLQQAIDAIVAHHEILRTNYVAENGNPIQVIAASQSVELQIMDLQQYEEAERERKVQELLLQEGQRPFNLASDSMLRSCLLQLKPQEHVLLVIMHHIASDNWSMGILWEQLGELYTAFLENKPNPLGELPIQYADYAVWQRQWLSGDVLDNHLNYWKQQLAGANPVLDLPTDRPRPAVQTYCGAIQSFIIPEPLAQSLKALCRQAGVTLFMVLLAAFQTLLYRYSKHEDIIVGSPIAGRNHAEVEDLIGFFVNTLVLRTDMSGNPSFLELLARVRSVTLDAYAHQDLSFDRLVEELQPERSLSYNPLFQVLFVLQNAPQPTHQLAGLTIHPEPVNYETAKFDLTLSMRESADGLKGVFEYNTDLFEADTIERMVGHFQTLLAGIVANPKQPIATLALLTEAEKQQLLVEWNQTQTPDWADDRCIHHLFEQQVERSPDAIAVVFGNQHLTYRELNSRANQLAHHLQSLGVGSETLVGVCMTRSPEMIVSLLGILKAGGAYVPIDPSYPVDRQAYMLADSQVRVLLTQAPLKSALPASSAHIICLDSDWQLIANHRGENPTTTVDSNHLAYVIYTSGSTGRPKGVMVTHRGLPNLVAAQSSAFAVQPSSRILQFASSSFDASISEVFMALGTGASLYLAPQDALLPGPAFLQLLQDHAITHLTLPPSALAILPEAELPALQTLIVAGEACPPALVSQWSKQRRFFNAYGPTEATVCATIAECEDTGKTPPIGHPIYNTYVYVLDSDRQPVPIGVPGELYIGGIGVARGYLNRPDLTQEKFIPNPFTAPFTVEDNRLYKTGDLARYRPDGTIEFLGRIDNQVKWRGFRIELGEIEAVLSQHPAVSQCSAIVREDDPGDPRLVAYVVSAQAQPPSAIELRQFLQQTLPDYMLPSAFVPLDALPLTPNGKIDRRALPKPDSSSTSRTETFVAPRTPVEQTMAQIWSQVLKLEQVGIHDNFFDLGGHSLLAARVVARIQETLQIDIPLRRLFETPNIAALAELCTVAQLVQTIQSTQTLSTDSDREEFEL